MYYKKKRTLEKFLVFGTILLTMIQPTWSEDILPEETVLEENKKSPVENLGDSKKILRLTLKDAVNYVLEKNITIQNAKMEM